MSGLQFDTICGKRLAHVNPKLNDARMWYVAIGNVGIYYLAIIANVIVGSKEINTGSVVHAVLMSEYKVVDEEVADEGVEGLL